MHSAILFVFFLSQRGCLCLWANTLPQDLGSYFPNTILMGLNIFAWSSTHRGSPFCSFTTLFMRINARTIPFLPVFDEPGRAM